MKPRSTLAIEIAWRIRSSWRAIPLLRRVARGACRAEGFDQGSLSVAVVGRRRMASLHEHYAGVREATDVLTFDLGCDPPAGRLDAEIVICSDVARQRARRRGGTLSAARAEIALYLVHGILHVAGYDDHDAAGFQRMHRREDEILSRLGVGPVFSEDLPAG